MFGRLRRTSDDEFEGLEPLGEIIIELERNGDTEGAKYSCFRVPPEEVIYFTESIKNQIINSEEVDLPGGYDPDKPSRIEITKFAIDGKIATKLAIENANVPLALAMLERLKFSLIFMEISDASIREASPEEIRFN